MTHKFGPGFFFLFFASSRTKDFDVIDVKATLYYHLCPFVFGSSDFL